MFLKTSPHTLLFLAIRVMKPAQAGAQAVLKTHHCFYSIYSDINKNIYESYTIYVNKM